MVPPDPSGAPALVSNSGVTAPEGAPPPEDAQTQGDRHANLNNDRGLRPVTGADQTRSVGFTGGPTSRW
jgi:hypothetical protein